MSFELCEQPFLQTYCTIYRITKREFRIIPVDQSRPDAGELMKGDFRVPPGPEEFFISLGGYWTSQFGADPSELLPYPSDTTVKFQGGTMKLTQTLEVC